MFQVISLYSFENVSIFRFLGKKYKCIDVTAVLCMCVGLILFTLADSSVSPSFNTYGMLLK